MKIILSMKYFYAEMSWFEASHILPLVKRDSEFNDYIFWYHETLVLVLWSLSGFCDFFLWFFCLHFGFLSLATKHDSWIAVDSLTGTKLYTFSSHGLEDICPLTTTGEDVVLIPRTSELWTRGYSASPSCHVISTCLLLFCRKMTVWNYFSLWQELEHPQRT